MTTSIPDRRFAHGTAGAASDQPAHDRSAPDSWLRSHRAWLGVDAAVTGANGVAYLALAPVLDGPLGLSVGTLRAIGVALTAFAVLVAITADRRSAPRQASMAIIAINATWVVASLAVAVVTPGEPGVVGRIWIVAQALVVAALAAGQASTLTDRGSR